MQSVTGSHVLRNGHFVGEYKTEELPRFKLVATMMGKEFDDLADIKGSGTSSKKQSDEVVIEAKGLYHKGTIKPFDIKIHKGEVVGLIWIIRIWTFRTCKSDLWSR